MFVLYLLFSTTYSFTSPVEECHVSSDIDCPAIVYRPISQQLDLCSLESSYTATEGVIPMDDFGCSFLLTVTCRT